MEPSLLCPCTTDAELPEAASSINLSFRECPVVSHPHSGNSAITDVKRKSIGLDFTPGSVRALRFSNREESYRWLVLACCYVTVVLSIGPGFTLGVYYNVLVDDFNVSVLALSAKLTRCSQNVVLTINIRIITQFVTGFEYASGIYNWHAPRLVAHCRRSS